MTLTTMTVAAMFLSNPTNSFCPREDDDAKRREAYCETVHANCNSTLQGIVQAELLVEIDELESMFNLSETGVKKLKLAARGAAKRAVDSARASNVATMRRTLERRLNDNAIDMTTVNINGEDYKIQMPEGVRPPKSDEDGPPVNKLGITLSRRGMSIYFTVRYQNGSSSTTLAPRGNDLRANALWQKNYNELLTAEQRKQYAAHRRQREKDAVTDMVMASLRYELRLTKEQIPKVRKVVSASLPATSTLLSSGMDYAVSRVRPNLKAKDFAEVLTESQLDLFSAAQAYYRRFNR